MNYILPEKPYQVLKWTALIALPAAATFVGTVGIATGWGPTGVVETIIIATGTLIGSLIGVSQATARTGAPAQTDDIKIGGTDD
jgi:hypothetical protein